MKILIDIGHPAHVHLFGPFAQQMIERGHRVLFTCREKEFEIALLKSYGVPYVSFGKKYKSFIGKLVGLIKFDLLAIIQGFRFRPDLLLSHGSPYAAHAAFALRKHHISLEDTGNMEQVRLYLPFTRHVLTSTTFSQELGKKQLRYPGYHELAYLHPNQFKPDSAIFELLGMEPGEPYCLLRFVAWNASHDRGHKGLTDEQKLLIVERLSKHCKVFISSENKPGGALEKYQIKIPPEKIHHALAFARIYVGESCTMASEAAMLGTPTLLVSGFPRDAFGTLVEQEDFGLMKIYTSFEDKLLKEIDRFLDLPRTQFDDSRKKMLSSKIDLTSFMIWFTENYPQSVIDTRNQQFKNFY